MKFGKRSEKDKPVSEDAAAAPSETWTEADARAAAPDPATRTWTEADTRAATAEPPAETWTAADERAAGDPGPVVDSEAVELTGSAAAPEPSARPVPLTIHDEPARPGAPSPAANPIVDVSAAPTTAPSYDGHAAEPPADPLQPVRALVAERPEVAVGAAFAGGILAAMILRRLGN